MTKSSGAMNDPFVETYSGSELAIAREFLTNWLPFLTRGLCGSCSNSLHCRVAALSPAEEPHDYDAKQEEISGENDPEAPPPYPIERTAKGTDPEDNSLDSADRGGGEVTGYAAIEPSGWGTDTEVSPKARMSWADMAQEDELEESVAAVAEGEKLSSEEKMKKATELPRAQREQIRFNNVGRKKDFMCFERVRGKLVNILEGLELHTGVFSAAEQKRIVDFVYDLQEKGRKSELGEHTYSEPNKWMRGKGRVTIQFGCCYNYAADKKGNPPGILRSVVADPIPSLFKVIIKRLIRWHVLPTSCIPDSCIVNIYEPGDCIPPHIDSHDFVRPFTTVSFLSECNILFGSELKVDGPGEFSGTIAIPLPVGSVLVLNGNAADVAKHCVPAVPTKRISITFRKMDASKWPFGFTLEPDLQNIQPLHYDGPEIPHRPESTNGQKNGSRRSSSSRRRNSRKGKDFSVTHDLNNSHYKRTPGQFVTDSNSATSSNDAAVSARRESAAARQQEQLHSKDSQHILRRSFPHLEEAKVEEGSNEQEGNSESFGRTVRMQQQRIVISKNIEGGRNFSDSYSRHPGHGASEIQTRTVRDRRRARVRLDD